MTAVPATDPSPDLSGQRFDVAIIGAGIVGTATALSLLRHSPRSLLLLEAEPRLAQHQSGHNSGVIHSGLYYKPGSLKARLCVEGRAALYRFCDEFGIHYERCGKVVVATTSAELAVLGELEQRGRANGLTALQRCSAAELRDREPNASGVGALLIDDTGIVDFAEVTRRMAEVVTQLGGVIRTGAAVREIRVAPDEFVLQTRVGEVRCRNLINCAGLQCDRVARMCGVRPDLRIVPFRGEYHRLRCDRRHLVRHLIYPVPDPGLPFLGVHFTRSVDGDVEAGPNAVIALARHGYAWSRVSVRDLRDMVGYGGFWRMAQRYWPVGRREIHRSLSLRATVRGLRRLLPALSPADLEPGRSGVRAQAVARDGSLVDDFQLIEGPGMLHVLNAPSPAATACLAIGQVLRERAARVFRPPWRTFHGPPGWEWLRGRDRADAGREQ